jgi:hypothetical protein
MVADKKTLHWKLYTIVLQLDEIAYIISNTCT